MGDFIKVPLISFNRHYHMWKSHPNTNTMVSFAPYVCLCVCVCEAGWRQQKDLNWTVFPGDMMIWYDAIHLSTELLWVRLKLAHVVKILEVEYCRGQICSDLTPNPDYYDWKTCDVSLNTIMHVHGDTVTPLQYVAESMLTAEQSAFNFPLESCRARATSL